MENINRPNTDQYKNKVRNPKNIASICSQVGSSVFAIAFDNVQLDYEERVKSKDPYILSVPAKKYWIKEIFIQKAELIPAPTTGELVVRLNDDNNLIFSQSENMIEATDTNITKALHKAQKSNEPCRMVFSDVEKVSAAISAYNHLEKERLNTIIEDLSKQIECIEDCDRTQNISICDDYLRRMNG